ncbi:hypothetical protein [Staphylococcus sp. NAM3COL9]
MTDYEMLMVVLTIIRLILF